MTGSPMINIENVSKWYGSFSVLRDCSLAVDQGEVVVVCGQSGSGKSTLIKTAKALEPFQKGKITVNGIYLADSHTTIAKLLEKYVMGFTRFALVPHLYVIQNLTFATTK